MATVDTVNAVYQAVVRTGPPPGYATAVAAQIDAGQLSFSTFSSNLISTPTVQSTTIPALVLYDAFYGSTENSGGLTFVTNEAAGLFATGGTTEFVYSSMGSWFALGANNFSALYGPLDRTTYIQTIYQNVFGTGPSTDAMNYLLGSLNSYVSADQAVGLANAELLGRGSVFGDLLYLAQTANTGNYAPGAAGFMNDLVSSAEANTTPTVYTETLSSIAPPVAPTVNLTTGIDHVVANSVTGSLTLFAADGVGPTLNSGDTIAGLTGASNNSLTINDSYGAAIDVIPTNAQISNEQNIILDTNGNAGGNAVFDTSGISGNVTTTVNSNGGGQDTVKVAPNATLNITHNGVGLGGVQTFGGSAVTVTSNGTGNVSVGSLTIPNANPSGAVTITENSSGVVTSLGGTTVNVTDNGLRVNADGSIPDPFDDILGLVRKYLNRVAGDSLVTAGFRSVLR